VYTQRTVGHLVISFSSTKPTAHLEDTSLKLTHSTSKSSYYVIHTWQRFAVSSFSLHELWSP